LKANIPVPCDPSGGDAKRELQTIEQLTFPPSSPPLEGHLSWRGTSPGGVPVEALAGDYLIERLERRYAGARSLEGRPAV